MKTSLGLVYGGKSAEHNVSLQTALAVTKALNTEKFDIHPIYITEKGEWQRGPLLTEPVSNVKMLQLEQNGESFALSALNREMFPEASPDEKAPIDVVFPLLHGPNGEDGTIQGLLELLNVPYVGNGVLASSAGMDKVIMKHLFAQAGLPQAKYAAFLKRTGNRRRTAAYSRLKRSLGIHASSNRRTSDQASESANAETVKSLKKPSNWLLSMTGKLWWKKESPAEKSKSAYSEMTNRNAPPSVKSRRKPTFTITRRNMKTATRI